MYNKLYGYGAIPQKYDDQNYELSKTNMDRAYQNDFNHWQTNQNTLGTATNMGIDALGLAGSVLAPEFAPLIMGATNSLKPSITGLVAPNASKSVSGFSGKQAGGLANILSGNNTNLGGLFGDTNTDDINSFIQILKRLFGSSWSSSGEMGYDGNLGGMA